MPIRYAPRKRPPCISRHIQLAIPTTDIRCICEELHGIAEDKRGASTFLIGPDDKETHCRFEWTHRDPSNLDAVRCAIELRHTQNGVNDAICWIALERWLSPDSSVAIDELRPRADVLLGVLHTILEDVISANHQRTWRIPYWVRMGARLDDAWSLSLIGFRSTIEPARIDPDGLPGRCIMVLSSASTFISAKARSKRTFELLCGILELFAGASISVNRTITNRLQRAEYTGMALPHEEWNLCKQPTVPGNVEELLDSLFAFVAELQEPSRTAFERSVLAYSTGLTLTKSNPTLACVAFCACMGTLAAPALEFCEGELTCSRCGGIDFKHHLTGDKKAIKMLVRDLLALHDKPDAIRSIDKLIDRVYNEQRSAYVHSAKLLPDDGQTPSDFSTLMPDATDGVSKYYRRELDLIQIVCLARAVLYNWLRLIPSKRTLIAPADILSYTNTIIGSIQVVLPVDEEVIVHTDMNVHLRSAGATDGLATVQMRTDHK